MDAQFADVERVFLERVVESASGNALMAHIATRITDEGLVLTLSDLPDAPLFTDEADIAPALDDLLWLIAEMSALVENQIAIGAHVRRFPLVLVEDPAWRLTRARSAATQDRLVANGVPDRKIRRVTSFGDREADRSAETEARNNRIEITFLR